TFPPEDEVYFAIVVSQEADRINDGLLKLYREGVKRNAQLAKKKQKPGSINNNVKFYITDNGEVYFHNYDFRESLRNEPLDAACMAKVDSILFAVWPPEVSARRSLLARDFIGYLGTLVGREKVHEIPVWTDASAVREEMRRMPATISLQ